MPKMDGITVVKKIRAAGLSLPVLMLTAKSEIDDRVEGLDAGADDYLTKPFAAKELMARVRAMTRRHPELADSTLRFSDLSLDRAGDTLQGPEGEANLSNKEFQIMELLLLNAGGVLSADRILEKVWGYDTEAEINVVWVYISALRKKMKAIGTSVRIKAARGIGYMLEETT